jgi:hypothetical protein
MVDVQFPHGSTRYPVEDLVISPTPNVELSIDVLADTVPGGAGTVSVSGGPPMRTATPPRSPKVGRVLTAYVKRAVYWASVNRKYKPTKEELVSGKLCCPRCEDAYFRKVVYKREDGKSVKLFCCPECLFLLRRDDVLGMEG